MKYKIKKGLIFEKKNKKITIFDPERSVILCFNETASYIFEKLKKGIDTKTIIKLMVKKYQVTNEQALIDLRELLKKIEKEKNN